jgi:cytochrome b pre-mRNA-processing protein 3
MACHVRPGDVNDRLAGRRFCRDHPVSEDGRFLKTDGTRTMAFLGLFGRNRHERAGFALYAAAVAAARDPFFYESLGVADTLDGRFDLLGLHAALLIGRLRALPPPGAQVAQAVFDAMFSDMDVNLREMGVGDLSVGKRVRAMWEAFHGRAVAYETALCARDLTALAEALRRNVWRGADAGGSPEALARLALAQDAALAAQAGPALLAGRVTFLPAARAVLPEAA